LIHSENGQKSEIGPRRAEIEEQIDHLQSIIIMKILKPKPGNLRYYSSSNLLNLSVRERLEFLCFGAKIVDKKEALENDETRLLVQIEKRFIKKIGK
jgi:hypothetical protein